MGSLRLICATYRIFYLQLHPHLWRRLVVGYREHAQRTTGGMLNESRPELPDEEVRDEECKVLAKSIDWTNSNLKIALQRIDPTRSCQLRQGCR